MSDYQRKIRAAYKRREEAGNPIRRSAAHKAAMSEGMRLRQAINRHQGITKSEETRKAIGKGIRAAAARRKAKQRAAFDARKAARLAELEKQRNGNGSSE